MLNILVFCLGLGLFALSFMVVLNSPEQTSPLYPGSNVRFLATMPVALLLLFVCPWILSFPPEIDVSDTLILVGLLAAHVGYSAWVESRYKGGVARRAMKAMVVDARGKPIPFKRALLRNLFKLVLLPLAPLSLYFMLKDFRRQAPHDKLAGTFVMWTPEAMRERQPDSSYEVDIQYTPRR